MEVKFADVNKGWVVVNRDRDAFGETIEEAISKFKVIAARHRKFKQESRMKKWK